MKIGRRTTVRLGRAVLFAAALALGGCGDEGSAGPDAGYTVQDIVDNPDGVVGNEVVVSGEVGDVYRPHAFTLESGDGESVLVVSPDQVVEGSVVRVTGRVVETPVDAAETSPVIAAFLGGITEEKYEHAILARDVDKLDGAGEY